MAPKPKPARFVYRRDGSCNGANHPSDVDVGCTELVADLPSSTFAFVLKRSTSFLPTWTPAGVLPPPAAARPPPVGQKPRQPRQNRVRCRRSR
jgi:hypothetical protein